MNRNDSAKTAAACSSPEEQDFRKRPLLIDALLKVQVQQIMVAFFLLLIRNQSYPPFMTLLCANRRYGGCSGHTGCQ